MRLLLVTAGSRGDVEPFVALARRAVAEGHVVRVAGPDNSGVMADGVDMVSLGVDYSRMIATQGVSLGAVARTYRTVVKPTMRAVIVGAARVAVDFEPDIIVYHPKVLSAPLIAAAMGIPHVLVEMVPAITPTRAFAAAGTVTADLGALNRLTYRAASGAASMFGSDLDEAAGVLGVQRTRRIAPPSATLLPISPALLQRPGDWPDNVHLTGAWLDGAATTPLAPEVAAFVSAGPFVYAGFGSMAAGDPVARGEVIIKAARLRHQRLLITTGLGGIRVPDTARSSDVLVVESVSHDLVLPHASAAIHHGGIGTVQAATRAGAVSLVVPFIADQPFWGALLARTGLAPAAIPRRKLTTDRLARNLEAAPRFASSVTSIGERMRAEEGTTAALCVIEAAASTPPSRRT